MKKKQASKRTVKRTIKKPVNPIVKRLATFLNDQSKDRWVPIMVLVARMEGKFLTVKSVIMNDSSTKLSKEWVKAKAAELEEEENGKATDDDVPF